MDKPATESTGARSFFAASEARVDRWRELHRVAKALAAESGSKAPDKLRQEAMALLGQLGPLEELCGYPGPSLLALVHERLKSADWTGLARVVQRISVSLLSNSYRDDPEAWKADEEEAHAPHVLPPSIGRGQARKPYFEVLIVSPSERSTWAAAARRHAQAPARHRRVRLRAGGHGQLRGRAARGRSSTTTCRPWCCSTASRRVRSTPCPICVS